MRMQQIEEYLSVLSDQEILNFENHLKTNPETKTLTQSFVQFYRVNREIPIHWESYHTSLHETKTVPTNQPEILTYQNLFQKICSEVKLNLFNFIAIHEIQTTEDQPYEILIDYYNRKKESEIVIDLGRSLLSELNKLPDSLHRKQQIQRINIVVRDAEQSLRPDTIGESNLLSLQGATQSGLAGVLQQLLVIRSSGQYELPEVRSQVDQIEKHIIGLARLFSGSDKLIDAYMQVWDFICSPSAKHLKWLGRWLMSPHGPIIFLDETVIGDLVHQITSTIAKEIKLENEDSALDYTHWWGIVKWGKEKNILSKERQIHSQNIKDIIAFFCKQGKIDEAKEINNLYKGHIQDDTEDLTFEINLGVIHSHAEKN